MINAEDPVEEIGRRIHAVILKYCVLKPEDIADNLILTVQGDRRPCVAKRGPNGTYIFPDVQAMIDTIKENGVKLLIIDPLVRMHQLDENNNDEATIIMDQFQHIATETGCAILIVHHTAKLPIAGADGYQGNADASRGAGGFVFAARLTHTLYSMSRREAELVAIPKQNAALVRLTAPRTTRARSATPTG